MALFFTSVGWHANAQYCAASANSTSFENVKNVTYAGINNTTSSHSGYNDFTAQVANVTHGDTNQISVEIKADGGDYLYAFIDWNQNDILDDVGEVYTLASSTSSDGPHTLDITVPAGASIGNTRMRVKLGWQQSSPIPCGSFSYGEIEDYTVNVEAAGGGGGGDIAECAADTPITFDPPYNVSSEINLTGTGVIGSGNGDYHFDDVTLNAQDGWVGDLNFFLISPSGLTLTLVSRKGGGSGLSSPQDLTFTDDSTNDINFWFSGAPLDDYQAMGGLLNDFFAGEPVNGTWTLNIVDVNELADGGSLNSFCINMSEITVSGNPPVLACPANITVNSETGVCGAIVNFVGVAFDDEDGNISGDIVATPASGSTFDVGDTTVELSVTDSDGNTVTCEFTITVLDDEAPLAICQDFTVDLDPVTGLASISADDINNGSTDNCGDVTLSVDISSFDCSMIGENTVELTVTDDAGNVSTCTATVTVQDVTAPEIVCVGGFGTFSVSEDFEGASVPAGWSTNIVSGSDDWAFGSGVMPTGADFATNAVIFDDDAAGSGAVNIVELISPVYDLTGATSTMISFDYALQDFAGFGLLRAEVWDGADWQEVFLVDDEDVLPTNTGDIDVFAYANSAFQVKFTFDDEGEWGWGAGVDTFLLTYESAAGGGLDVYLDADGMATVDPNDLILTVNEACGYTVTAGGSTGGGSGSLTTTFTSNNGGSAGWTVMYNLTVGPNDIEITDLDVNTDDTGAINLDLYTLEGSYGGNETNPSAWGAAVTTGTGTGVGIDQPSNVVLATPVMLSANTTYGIAVVMDVKPKYTNGTGCSGNQCYDNDDISLSLGTAVAGLFSGSVFPNRVWNGTVHYNVTNGSGGLSFTCADLGENVIEVIVTDASGNTASCMAVVNVIDNIAPVIVCAGSPGAVSTVEDFEGSTIPSGWTTDVEIGTYDWTFGSGNMPTGDDFPTNAAIFDDNEVGSGQVNKATLISPVYDISTSTTNSISFDYAMQEYVGDGTLTVEVFDGTAWQEILFVDVDTSPTNTGDLDMAAYANANFQARFVFDDEGNWGWGAGIDNFTLNYELSDVTPIAIALGPDGTTDIDPYDLIQSIEEACGISTVAVDISTVTCADIGTPISITVFVSDTSGNVTSCTALVNVVDTMGPEITCPADQIVDPGSGNLFYIVPDYFATGEATAEDNCTDPVTITTQDPAPGAALPDGDHTITMTATDEYGNTSTCSFEITVDTVVGIDDNSLETGLSLYPNPAKNVVNLVNKTNISLEKMMIYDINGKLINQINLRTMQGEKAVDVSSLASGVYVVQIIGENASTVKRLIKE